MTSTTSEVDDLTTAEREAREAEALIGQLEGRVVAGDASVTASQIEEQRGLAKFAQLRLQAAKNRVAEAKAARTRATAKALAEELAGFDTRDGELVEAWTDAVQALRKLHTLAVERSVAVWDADARANEVDGQLGRQGEKPLAEYGVLPALYGGEKGFRVPAKGLNVADVAPAEFVATAVHEAVDRGALSSVAIKVPNPNADLASTTLAARVQGWPSAVRNLQETR